MEAQPFSEDFVGRWNHTTQYPRTAEYFEGEYEGMVCTEREEIERLLKKYGLDVMPEDVQAAKDKFETAQRALFDALLRSREAAPPITVTGSANYKGNPQKGRKIEESAQGAVQKARTRMYRTLFAYNPEGRVSSDAPDAVDQLREKIQRLEEKQARMKGANKAARKAKEEKPFHSFELTNNNASIRSARLRITEIERHATDETSETIFKGGRIVDSVEDNRVQVFFNGRPDEEMRSALKGRGFRWAPSVGAWQRMRSSIATAAAQQVVGVTP